MSNDIKFRAILDDKVSGSLGKIADNFDRLGGKGSAASLFGNVGAKAVAAGFNLMTRAADGFTTLLGDSISAAIEDEHSQQRLGIALKDNIAGWDGNTASIEKVIKARENLAFSDEEQRRGLSTLVAVTRDATVALTLEGGAMDIARARGVDLETATDAVAKAYAGNTKALKALIPGLQLGATSAETLANAFGMVKGQADAYADTSAGKVEKAQIKINEAMERAGYTILPLVAAALDDVSFALDRTSIPMDVLIKTAQGTTDAARVARNELKKLGIDIDRVGKEADDAAQSVLYMNRAISSTPTLGGGGRHVKGHAAGGHASAGDWSIVGEQGPELRFEATSANYVNAQDTAQMLGGGTSVVINYNVGYSTASPAEAQRFARAVMPEVIREARRQGVAA